MLKLVGGTAVLLVVIVGLTMVQRAHPGLDPHDQLLFEKQQARQRAELIASHASFTPALECATARLSRRTVQTLYLTWINQRSDLTTDADHDAATADLAAGITACDSTVDALTNEAHDKGLELEHQAALAALTAGH